jgi:hypothetical protein
MNGPVLLRSSGMRVLLDLLDEDGSPVTTLSLRDVAAKISDPELRVAVVRWMNRLTENEPLLVSRS